MKLNKKNNTLYLIKAIACFCVVFIHISFPGKIGFYCKCLSNFAVPLFFMISGYYTYYDDKEYTNIIINKRLKKIIKLTLISFCFYLIINIIVQNLNLNWDNYLNQIKSKQNILNFLFLNYTTPFIGVGHLWYLVALIYVYLLFKLINKTKYLYKKAYVYSVFIIIIVYVFGIINTKKGLNIDSFYWRNAWFMGFPFFMFGLFIHKNEKKFLWSKEKFKKRIFIIIMSTLLIYILEMYLINDNITLFLSNILIDFILFITALNYPNISFLNFNDIGQIHSSNIYIIHYAVIILFQNIGLVYMNSIIIKVVLPFVVILMSYFISKMCIMMKNFYKKLNK